MVSFNNQKTVGLLILYIQGCVFGTEDDTVCSPMLELAKKTDICNTGQRASCSERCGTFSSSFDEVFGCSCDSLCLIYRDCCADFRSVCGDIHNQASQKFPDVWPLYRNKCAPPVFKTITAVDYSARSTTPLHSSTYRAVKTTRFSSQEKFPSSLEAMFERCYNSWPHAVVQKKTGFVFGDLSSFKRIIGNISLGEFIPLYLTFHSLAPYSSEGQEIEEYLKNARINGFTCMMLPIEPRSCSFSHVICKPCEYVAALDDVCFKVANSTSAASYGKLRDSQYHTDVPEKTEGEKEKVEEKEEEDKTVKDVCRVTGLNYQAIPIKRPQLALGTVRIQRLSLTEHDESSTVEIFGTPWKKLLCHSINTLDLCLPLECSEPTFRSDDGLSCILPTAVTLQFTQQKLSHVDPNPTTEKKSNTSEEKVIPSVSGLLCQCLHTREMFNSVFDSNEIGALHFSKPSCSFTLDSFVNKFRSAIIAAPIISESFIDTLSEKIAKNCPKTELKISAFFIGRSLNSGPTSKVREALFWGQDGMAYSDYADNGCVSVQLTSKILWKLIMVFEPWVLFTGKIFWKIET